MGSHPVNLAVRFLLEVVGLVALAWTGWELGKGVFKYVFAIGFSVLAAALWGIFAVRGDPSRSGSAVIAVPGVVRLVLELGFFAVATWSLVEVGARTPAGLYAVAVVVHYLASYDRIAWLLQQ